MAEEEKWKELDCLRLIGDDGANQANFATDETKLEIQDTFDWQEVSKF